MEGVRSKRVRKRSTFDGNLGNHNKQQPQQRRFEFRYHSRTNLTNAAKPATWHNIPPRVDCSPWNIPNTNMSEAPLPHRGTPTQQG